MRRSARGTLGNVVRVFSRWFRRNNYPLFVTQLGGEQMPKAGGLAARAASNRSTCKGPLGLPCAVTPKGQDRQAPHFEPIVSVLRAGTQSMENPRNIWT